MSSSQCPQQNKHSVTPLEMKRSAAAQRWGAVMKSSAPPDNPPACPARWVFSPCGTLRLGDRWKCLQGCSKPGEMLWNSQNTEPLKGSGWKGRPVGCPGPTQRDRVEQGSAVNPPGTDFLSISPHFPAFPPDSPGAAALPSFVPVSGTICRWQRDSLRRMERGEQRDLPARNSSSAEPSQPSISREGSLQSAANPQGTPKPNQIPGKGSGCLGVSTELSLSLSQPKPPSQPNSTIYPPGEPQLCPAWSFPCPGAGLSLSREQGLSFQRWLGAGGEHLPLAAPLLLLPLLPALPAGLSSWPQLREFISLSL